MSKFRLITVPHHGSPRAQNPAAAGPRERCEPHRDLPHER
jgi:hypothetical protein